VFETISLTSPLPLESGEALPDVTIAYRTWGTLAADASNAVLVQHALTGDQDVTGWWPGLVGPGAPLDTRRLFVVASNVLGGCNGTTGPTSTASDGRPWGSRFPRITVRDQVAAEAALADLLGIDAWAAVIGGSMGGMRALEWAVSRPERVRSLLSVATTAVASADQIGWCVTQLHAIRADPGWSGGDYHPGPGPVDGLGIARRIAHLTYRSAPELAVRFGAAAQTGEDPAHGGRYAVESYLDHHAGKLVRRFDAGTYVVLTEAMNGHDLGRGRGGVAAALARITARTVVVAVDSDRLYLAEEQAVLAAGIRGAGEPRVVKSLHGHDGFLLEVRQVGAIAAELLESVRTSGTRAS
jgi:homoserine O-acetyltransferase